MLARDVNNWLRKTECPCTLTLASVARILNKFRHTVRIIITRLLTVKREIKWVTNDIMEMSVREKVMAF
jgi:hypothetical protein